MIFLGSNRSILIIFSFSFQLVKYDFIPEIQYVLEWNWKEKCRKIHDSEHSFFHKFSIILEYVHTVISYGVALWNEMQMIFIC